MAAAEQTQTPVEKKPVSLFDLSPDFFDFCILLRSKHSSPPSSSSLPSTSDDPPQSSNTGDDSSAEAEKKHDSNRTASKGKETLSSRWTCNTCHAEFESLQDQRSHFKSDLHRLNVKLNLSGKKSVKEEDIEGLELNDNSLLEDLEISSISGSEDSSEEDESLFLPKKPLKNNDNSKQKLYFNHPTGDTISLYKCLLLDESEDISYSSSQNEEPNYITQEEIINRLKKLITEPRDKTCIRIILLTSGGHFAGCVFDGKSILAHKTFHRYVVRAKSGKQQSTNDASGKIAHSAGSSIRRYNEAALKKEIQELIVTWKPYFDSCKWVMIHAPVRNRLVFHSVLDTRIIRNIPLTVRRPTFKEAKRIYTHLSQLYFQSEEDKKEKEKEKEIIISPPVEKENKKAGKKPLEQIKESDSDISQSQSQPDESTELHVAAREGDVAAVMKLLEEGWDPCIKDERGRTSYMVAVNKEVRDSFRRYMAVNPDKWDWHAANVPSALTKEMEESQALKQAEKDAKRKARAKELKKIKKAKEKEREKERERERERERKEEEAKEKARLAWMPLNLLTEEERERRLKEEREKRAAAAERRIAGIRLQETDGNVCSYCRVSLDGKVPFHRYSYKYCSPTCMHVHGENLQQDI